MHYSDYSGSSKGEANSTTMAELRREVLRMGRCSSQEALSVW